MHTQGPVINDRLPPPDSGGCLCDRQKESVMVGAKNNRTRELGTFEKG